MNKTSDDTLRALADLNGEQRYKYMIKSALENEQIWILADEDGCVMLNTQDEDCVPIWPHEEAALAWANGQWKDCKPTAIALKKWLQDWTPGLIEDDLALAVFPNAEEEGLVIYPDELDFALKRKMG